MIPAQQSWQNRRRRDNAQSIIGAGSASRCSGISVLRLFHHAAQIRHPGKQVIITETSRVWVARLRVDEILYRFDDAPSAQVLVQWISALLKTDEDYSEVNMGHDGTIIM